MTLPNLQLDDEKVRRNFDYLDKRFDGYIKGDDPKLLVQTGTITITPVANTRTTGSIAFPVAYSSVPTVFLSPVTNLPYTSMKGATVYGMSESGADVWIYCSSTTPLDIDWMAIGVRR